MQIVWHWGSTKDFSCSGGVWENNFMSLVPLKKLFLKVYNLKNSNLEESGREWMVSTQGFVEPIHLSRFLGVMIVDLTPSIYCFMSLQWHCRPAPMDKLPTKRFLHGVKLILREHQNLILLIRDMVVKRCNRWFGHETIHPTKKITSMNLLQMSCVIT